MSDDNNQQHQGEHNYGTPARPYNYGPPNQANVAVHLRTWQSMYGPWWPLPQPQPGRSSADSVPGKLPSDTAGGGNPGYYQHLLGKVHLGITGAANAGGMQSLQHGNLQHCATSRHIPAEEAGNTSFDGKLVRFNRRSGNNEDVTPWARFKGGQPYGTAAEAAQAHCANG